MRPIWTTVCVYLLAVVAVFGLQFLAVTALLAGHGGALDLEHDAVLSLLVAVPASSLALIAIAGVAAGRPWAITLRLVPSPLPPRSLLVMIVGVLALSQALDSLTHLLGIGPGPAIDWIVRAMAAAPPRAVLLAVLVVGVLAPVGEELFFRGYMQTRLRRVWRPGPAVLVTALAFGMIHGELVHGVLAAGIGLYLGVMTERTASVMPAVICHVANNTASVLLSAWVGSMPGRGLNAVLLVVMAVIVAGALRRLLRLPPPPDYAGRDLAGGC
jgi:membrane protease YdiL (CAAX protease family)